MDTKYAFRKDPKPTFIQTGRYRGTALDCSGLKLVIDYTEAIMKKTKAFTKETAQDSTSQ